ncbi:Na+/H+ antiporter subunit G [Roseovarius spongiae]|uniref:Na+/H+ antiporter subunit G n=1 Tax=Roseovarius spongiae TaxID=2320272 RepID=A0A3A8AXC5_9RHOB|nr:Na+/H+ antiporter subunit G [Roseovarius spongiae]RKF14711.1 Na+/H+ antiporter subunit G [Roseovarius spongiae]
MTAGIIATWAIAISLLIGSFFCLVGAIGLLRFRDSMVRLHAPTKVGTMGVGGLLLAAMIHSYTFEQGSLHELLIMGFLFVTAPISANFIAKVHLHHRTCKMPDPPPHDETWATLDVPEADLEIEAQSDA